MRAPIISILFVGLLCIIATTIATPVAAATSLSTNNNDTKCKAFVVSGGGGSHHIVNPATAWAAPLSGFLKDPIHGISVYFIFSLCTKISGLPHHKPSAHPAYVFVNPNALPGPSPIWFDELHIAYYDASRREYRLRFGASAADHAHDGADVTVRCGGTTHGLAFGGPDFSPSKNANGGLTAKFDLVSLSMCANENPTSTTSGPPIPPPPPTLTTSAPLPPGPNVPFDVIQRRLELLFSWAPGDTYIDWFLTTAADDAGSKYFAVAVAKTTGMANGTGVACTRPTLQDPTSTVCTAINTTDFYAYGHGGSSSLVQVVSASVVGSRAHVHVRVDAGMMQVSGGGGGGGGTRIIAALGPWNATTKLPMYHGADNMAYTTVNF